MPIRGQTLHYSVLHQRPILHYSIKHPTLSLLHPRYHPISHSFSFCTEDPNN
uniref:Uncharacterized protein n=1 Tax=Rhizophora mucronata TaxID=61149 RepID=A0A2P2IW62_RHIMU